MADVAQLGVQVTKTGVDETAASLAKLSGAAARAQTDTEGLSSANRGAAGAASTAAKAYADEGTAAASASKQVELLAKAANQNNTALNASIAPSKNVAYQARMMALQLSQVAQQTQAGGDFIRALAIQLPDLATGFGAVGIAIGVVGGVALQYFGTLIGSGSDAAKVLKEQQQIIEATVQAWGNAVPALTDYVDLLQRAADLKNLDASLKILNDQTIANVKASVEDLRDSFLALNRDLQVAGEKDEVIDNLSKAFHNFVEAAQNGKDVTSQVQAVQEALSASINSTGISALSSWAAEFNGVATAAANAAGKVEKLSNAALTAKLFGEDKLNPLSPLSIFDSKVVANDQNPAGTVVTDDGRYVPIPTPSDRPSTMGFAPPKSNTSGLKRNADAYRDLIKNAQDRIDQMKLEAQTAGETGIAAETLSFKLKLLQDATDKGRTVTAAQRAEIEKLTQAYKEAATAAATAKLQSDLAFQQRQMGRSTIDQTVASTLQQYGLPEDLNSYEAGLIRANEQMKTARELAGDFVTTLTNGLRNGEGLWKSFGNAALSVLNKITDTLLNDVLNALFKVNSTGSSGGGLLSSLLGLGSSSAASAFPAAPSSSIGLFANGTASAPGGLAWVGERGPELVNLPRGAQVVPNHRLSGANQNDASGSASGVNVTVGVSVDQNGNLKAYVKSVAQSEAKGAVGQYDSQVLPSRVNQINQDPRAR